MEGAENMVVKDLDTGKRYVLNGTGSLETETGQKVVLEQFKAEVRGRPGGTSMDMTQSASSSDDGTPRSPNSGHPRLERTLGFRVPKRIKEGLAKMTSLESPHSTSMPSVMTTPPNSNSGAQGSEESMSSSSVIPIPHSPLSWNDSSSTTSHTRSETIKVTVNRRRNKEMSDIRLVQELHSHEGVVWVMKFSPDGEYLATGGKDASILLWAVVSKRGQDKGNAFQTELPVFDSQPCRTWHGHTADVLDIAWSSASELILSASLDKTVRLWTVSQDACLREIQHQTWVTSVRFHPQDPSKFISGCGNGFLRLWDLMARKVIGSASIAGEKDLYTALSFNDDGKMILAGSYKGKCRLYQIIDRKIEIKAEIDVRNRRGRHARGKKVTGVEFSIVDGQPRFLVTTSDSRIRMLQGTTSAPSEVAKFKGHMNESGRPVGASTSPRGDYVICGSDDGRVFVWPFSQGEASTSPRGYKSVSSREKVASFETFRAHNGFTTSAIFAPDTCRRPFGFLDSEQEQVDSTTPPTRVRMQHILFQCQGSNGSGDYKGIKLWGQVMVTAGQGGEIRVWENFGLPVSHCS